MRGYSTVSRSGVRRRSQCGTPATNSLVPMHAARWSDGTAAPKRRSSHAAAAARKAGVPTDGG